MLAIITPRSSRSNDELEVVPEPPVEPRGKPVPAPGRSNGASPPPLVPDSELGKIVKLVPTEVVGLYVTALGFADQVGSRWFEPIAFAICLPLIVFILYFDSKQSAVVPPSPQYVLRVLSFAAWALAISRPLAPWLTIPTAIPALLVLVLPIVGARLIR